MWKCKNCGRKIKIEVEVAYLDLSKYFDKNLKMIENKDNEILNELKKTIEKQGLDYYCDNPKCSRFNLLYKNIK